MLEIFGGIGLCLALLALYDFTVCGRDARWFELHAVANAFVAIFSLRAMYVWMIDPIKMVAADHFEIEPVFSIQGLFSPVSHWYVALVDFHMLAIHAVPTTTRPTMMVNAIHTYHMVVFYKKLNGGDYFHHLVFVPVIGIFGGLFFNWGPARNVLAFFISGFPGGVDYVMLVLVKRGRMSKMCVLFYYCRLQVTIDMLNFFLFQDREAMDG